MLAFATISMLATTAAAAAASSSSSSAPPYDNHRILTNSETGTIIHPLIPHKAHLNRRRRELHDKYHGTGETILDTSLPDRPHISRHSQTPANDRVISALRASNRNTNGDDRHLQQQMGALYQGYGTHYIDLWVGSPTPQRQTVIVDTGSGVTAFPCEECKGCGDQYHTDTYFKHSQSTTFRALACNECFKGSCSSRDGKKQCRMSMSYAEGSSWSAYESNDLCYAGGPHDKGLAVNGPMTNEENVALDHIDQVDASQFAFELKFGCQTSITGLFITQLADGIMGMENEKTSFWKQMHLKNAIPRPEFSLCFSRNDSADRDGTSAGAMTLGGVDTRLHASPMVFAKNVKSSGFYAVHLKAVYLREGGGVSAQTTQGDMGRMHKLAVSESNLNRGNTIVDSGTTDTYFTRSIAGQFKTVWKKLTGNDYSHTAVSLTEEQIRGMPTIVLVMSGVNGTPMEDEPTGEPNDVPGFAGDTDLSDNPRDVVIAIPASHYMEYDSETGKYVPRFYTEESSGSVIGANAMMGHDVYFDADRARIGFAESDCDYVSLLLSEGMSVSVAPTQNKVSTEVEVPAEQEEEVEEEQEASTTIVPEEVEEEELSTTTSTTEATTTTEMEEEEVTTTTTTSTTEVPAEPPVDESQEEEEDTEVVNDRDPEGGGTVLNDPSSIQNEPIEPGPDQSEINETPYELFDNDNKPQGHHLLPNTNNEGFAAKIIDDMKHECSSTGCRGIAALFILGAVAIVIAGIRRAIARRRVIRQYQEAELEISDLALDSDSDDDNEGGYVDEPPMPQIT